MFVTEVVPFLVLSTSIADSVLLLKFEYTIRFYFAKYRCCSSTAVNGKIETMYFI
jgi:hypothetical protein